MSASTERQSRGNEIVFGRIIPCDGPAFTDACIVAELCQSGILSDWHKESFHAKRNPDFDDTNPELLIENDPWTCHWTLSLANVSRNKKANLVFRVGKEFSFKSPGNSMEDPGFGIDILTGHPTLPQTQKVQLLMKLGSGGAWVIESTSDKEPVTVSFEGGERITLLAGETCTLRCKTNQVQIGKRRWNIVFDSLDAEDENKYLDERDSAIEDCEGIIPDACLWALPGTEDLTMIGRAIFRKDRESEKPEQIRGRMGIDARTGKALLVKSTKLGETKVGGNLTWEHLLLEMEFLLVLKGIRGLIQALEVRCEHGYYTNPKIVAENGGKIDPLCDDPDCVVHIITEHYTSFATIDWARYKLCDKLCLFRDILEGVKKVHADGAMVRTIDEWYLKVIPTEPPKAVLTEFGCVFRGMNAITSPVCREYIRAPEIWRTLCASSKYTSKTDMWHLGVIGLSMFIPDVYQTNTNCDSAQNRDWRDLMFKSLDEDLSSEGAEEGQIAEALKRLLRKREINRPTAEDALMQLPEYGRETGSYIGPVIRLDPDDEDDTTPPPSFIDDESEDDQELSESEDAQDDGVDAENIVGSLDSFAST